MSGTHSYATDDTYTVGVSISSIAGGSASISDSVTVADGVGMTTCTGSGCSGTVTTPDETVQLDSTSTTGTILTTVDPADTAPDCGPYDLFRHAPEVTTFDAVGLDANIVFTVSFANNSAAGLWWVPFAVCYQAQTPFVDLFGQTVTTGLLPPCTLFPHQNSPAVAPCVESISDSSTVVETILVPPSDPPKFH